MYPDGWDAARQRHHAILREAIEAQQGYIFQISGDAFCAAFHSPADGLNACLAAQRALNAEAWGEASISVRMGLHTGEAESRGDDYHGYLALSRVQRLMSSAYGGQVLLSTASQVLVHDRLPPEVMLRNLGEVRLKDFPQPERIYQLVAPDLPSSFPPLKTLSSIPNNLPVQLTSFVGRDTEMAEVKRLLADVRLLTLTGSGGTGKTRLSLQVAADLLDQYPDGVWFVELAPLTDPAFVPQTVASALSVREQPGRPIMATLTDHLRDQQLLLVLDNCEHMIEACAQLADTLLHAAPRLKIAASSREALGIAGEHTYPVPSLSSPDTKQVLSAAQVTQYEGVRLFVDRAMAVHPHFKVTDANAAAWPRFAGGSTASRWQLSWPQREPARCVSSRLPNGWMTVSAC